MEPKNTLAGIRNFADESITAALAEAYALGVQVGKGEAEGEKQAFSVRVRAKARLFESGRKAAQDAGVSIPTFSRIINGADPSYQVMLKLEAWLSKEAE